MKLKIQLESVMLCRFFKFNYNTLQFNRVEKAQINNSLLFTKTQYALQFFIVWYLRFLLFAIVSVCLL